jgi:hypothetical protein
MYLVTTPQRPGALRALRRLANRLVQQLQQRLRASPASELEALLAGAQNAAELDFLERNWAHAHRRRFG